MDQLISLIIYLVIVVVWLISISTGRKRWERQQEEEFPHPIPIPSEGERGEEERPAIKKKGPETKLDKGPLLQRSPSYAHTEVTDEFGFDITNEVAEEGIILSVVLGPPKAYKYIRK